MKYLLLQPDIYPLTFHVLIGKWNRKEAKSIDKRFRRLEDPNESGGSWDCGSHQVIWMRSAKTLKARGIIIHEMEHAVLQAADHLGFEDTDRASEFYTYLMQWLFMEIWQWLDR